MHAIAPKWLEQLELGDVISEITDDLYIFPNWQLSEFSFDDDVERICRKYPGC